MDKIDAGGDASNRTLLDEFAGKAMQSVIEMGSVAIQTACAAGQFTEAGKVIEQLTEEKKIAVQAYALASAMIAEKRRLESQKDDENG